MSIFSARKHQISRLEEFSDAVFGFALTLLVITSSVPRSYEDLMALVRGIPAFACCFALLGWVWTVERRRQALEATAIRNRSQVT